MGRVGSCFDNAVAGCFCGRLKVELCNRRRFQTRAEARLAIFAWLNYYNNRRLHSKLRYCTPVAFEQKFAVAKGDDDVVASMEAA